MHIASPHDVLTFWFAPGQSDRWYAEDEAFDAEIRQRFLPTYEAARSGYLDAWRKSPNSLLALIIVLDQFPRNMFRGSARAFTSDAQVTSDSDLERARKLIKQIGLELQKDPEFAPLIIFARIVTA
jgi:uncharacterized protein (DUF924 family)